MPASPATTVDDLRRHALARTFGAPTTLPRALARLGFVQADPLRAPARAQDLTLRQRVRGYRAGDLERRYASLAVEEDFFVNYGYVTAALHALMHPRTPRTEWTAERRRQAESVLAFVRERGVVHPREVDAAFAHGKVLNWFGGSGRASTALLDAMHYRGWLRVARREAGTRLYAVRPAPVADAPPPDAAAALDAMVDVAVGIHAPLPARSLARLVGSLRGGAPQWAAQRAGALARARHRLAHADAGGTRWYWPAAERPRRAAPQPVPCVRLLAPFDPLVWDRDRFERLWGWAYRFEAYTPAARRLRGHYALPLLWREDVVGWANASLRDGRLAVATGFVAGRAPRGAAFASALDDEVRRLAAFLGVDAP